MYKKILFCLICILLLTQAGFSSQEILQKLKMLKQFKNTQFSSKMLEAERDKKIGKITTTQKGEFETTAMYNKRLRNAEKEAEDIRLEYTQKIEIARRKFNERKADIEKEIQDLLLSSQEKVTSSFSLGKYDADKQEFSITLSKTGESSKIKVPLSLAQPFKNNSYNLIATGMRQLNEDGYSEYFNWYITYQGQTFAFGKQTETVTPIYVEVKPTSPPDLKVISVDFKDDNLNSFLEAEEQGKMIITISNEGKGSAYGISAKLNSKGNYDFLDYRTQRYMAEIKPGEKKSVEFLFTANYDTPSQDCAFSITFDEANGFYPDPVNCSFQTKKLEPPIFFVEKGIEDASGNFAIEQKEIVKVTVRLANTGGEAKDVSLSIKKGNNVFFTGDTKTHFNWDTIEKGDFKDISFDFYTNKKVKDEIPLSVLVSADHFNKEFPLNLKIKQREISPQSFAFKGKESEEIGINIPGLVIDIEENIPQCTMINKDAVAVVIGNRNYSKKDVPPVKYANRDANFVKQYLINTLGYREGNIIYVNDASQADFNSIFGTDKNHKGKLYNYVKSGKSDIFIYYSGHGAPDPESKNGYFVPVDCDPSLVALNGYSLNIFYKNLSKIDYKSLTVVMDACFSGSSEGGMLLKNISPIFIKVDNPITAKENSVIFTSATGEQVSSWYPEKKHSLFTYYFLKALQGEADKNQDSKLTVSEIKTFVDDNVPYMARRLNNREQTPQVIGSLDKVVVEY